MSYDVWLFAPTYARISTKLSLYLVNKALSLHNILVFSFHAYRTRQMSMNGGTKNEFFVSSDKAFLSNFFFSLLDVFEVHFLK